MGPRHANPRRTDPRCTDPRCTDPRCTDPRRTDPRRTDPRRTDPRRSTARAACAAILAVAVACEPPRDPDAPPDPRPFAEAFPDATELVTTPDPEATRERLDGAILPEDDPAHDAEIAALVDAVATIDPEHLTLVIDSIASDAVADETLLAASARLAPLDPAGAGAVLGRARTDATLGALADVLLPRVDDGSPETLREILYGFADSPRREQFILDVVASGELDPDLEDVALHALASDDHRVALLRHVFAGRESLPLAEVLEQMPRLKFDRGRLEFLELTAPRLAGSAGGSLDGATVNGAVLDGAALVDVFRHLASGEARARAVELIVGATAVRVRFEALDDLLLGLGNDEQRLAALATLVGTIADEPNAVSAGAAIRTFETPEGRVEAVRTLAAPLRALDERARRSLLGNLPEARRDEANGWIDEAG